jgi:N-acetylmuramoyl-L-alanine amidase
MSKAKLRASLSLWRRREEFRKDRHSRWQKRIERIRAAGGRPGQQLYDQRDKWSRLLEEARGMVARRERQLRELQAPPIIVAAQLGLTFQWVFGDKGNVFRGAWHYTAGHRSKDKKALIAEMRADHSYHKGLGWGGLSYEAMIADDGTIGFGNPVRRKSAAVASSNTGMVNICCPGTTGNDLTEAQGRSVAWLKRNWHTSKVPKAHRLPKPASSLGWKGHREWPLQSTACPGQMLDDFKRAWK